MKVCHAQNLATNSKGQGHITLIQSASHAVILGFASGSYFLQG